MKGTPTRHIVVLAIFAVVTLSIVPVLFRAKEPTRVFQEVVLEPVPKSVKNVRATYRRFRPSWTGHTYVLRFDISKADVSLLLTSEAFTEIEHIKYNDHHGVLSYGSEDRTVNIHIYEPLRGEQAPKWFEFGTWDSSKAYLVEEEELGRYRMRLLLYHEGRGQAYFIEHEIKGPRQVRWSVLRETQE